ncbi:hypothetical protein [Limnochorda pilosa]|uniref:Uncharacterized protein n=1 Tax=Limnochorda pilosa TaxID=1555112 RepID=A0A0K2SHK9_LIMPI|nr:hypothetical protein [Limnochorda pilosa]BAS26522.1 hypothetical protein LIP_0665 [Limnochorda pilosa]
MAGMQKNIRLSRRGLELLHALKYALDLSDNQVIEAALFEAAEHLLHGCGQRLALAPGGLLPESERERLRAQAAVLVHALNTDADRRWPRYRLDGDQIQRELDGGWQPWPGGPESRGTG